MVNLIKYELRGKLLTLLGVCLTVIMGNLFLMTKINSWEIGVPVLSTFLGSGAVVVIFISSLTLMSDYLYDEQGYLLFTLPQSGFSLLTSRLGTALIQISTVTIVALLMFCLIDKEEIVNGLLLRIQVQEVVGLILLYLWVIVSVLTSIYFCMVVGKIALKGKKIGKIGSFILFFIFSIVVNRLTERVEMLFPQMVKVDSMTLVTLNIGGTIFEMLVFVILFILTSYLLEKKVDL